MQMPSNRQERFHFTPAQVLVLGFATLIVVGAFVLWLPVSSEPGKSLSFVDALFTATSAVCVTGLIVVDTASQFSPFGEWFILALIQAGGLGIMTLSTLMILLMGKRISLRERLVMQSALGSFSIAGVVRLTRNIIVTTLAIEATGALLLWGYFAVVKAYPMKQAAYWGLFHAVSAFNNAGFDVTRESLRGFGQDPFVLMVIAVLLVLGGLGFFVIEDVWRNRRWEKFSLHSRLVLKVSFWLTVIPAVLYFGLEYANPETFGPMPFVHKMTNALFSAVTPRTAGFESVVTGAFRDATLLMTIILMFVGASPGGTGGGVKTTTAAMIAITLRATAKGTEEIQMMNRRLPKDLVDKSITIVAIAIALVLTVTGILLVTEQTALEDPASPISFIHVLFEVVSAFGTVGLSAGLSGELTSIGKVLITITMFVGRVGPLTMAAALAQRKLTRDPIHYPEDRVMIG
jgi:trk system potassium uptake protein TrkH